MAGSQFKNWCTVLYISWNVLSFQCPKKDCLLLAVYERKRNGYVINDVRCMTFWISPILIRDFNKMCVRIYVCLCCICVYSYCIAPCSCIHMCMFIDWYLQYRCCWRCIYISTPRLHACTFQSILFLQWQWSNLVVRYCNWAMS